MKYSKKNNKQNKRSLDLVNLVRVQLNESEKLVAWATS